MSGPFLRSPLSLCGVVAVRKKHMKYKHMIWSLWCLQHIWDWLIVQSFHVIACTWFGRRKIGPERLCRLRRTQFFTWREPTVSLVATEKSLLISHCHHRCNLTRSSVASPFASVSTPGTLGSAETGFHAIAEFREDGGSKQSGGLDMNCSCLLFLFRQRKHLSPHANLLWKTKSELRQLTC